MSLLLQLETDLKTAMLARETVSVGVLRMVKSELKNAEISQGAALEDAQIIQTIQK